MRGLSEAERETTRAAVSEACDRFMRKAGERYPWLHPDYDPRSITWQMRADRARQREAKRRRRYG